MARPSQEELNSVPHHFIACRSITNPYNVYSFEQEALQRIEQLFEQHDTLIAVGGSGLYIDALTKGVAILPDPLPGLREQLKQQLETEGIACFQRQLKQLDPKYYERVDLKNPVRLQRALEVCITAGRPYSELLEQKQSARNFETKKTVLTAPNDTLRQRINLRVDQMLEMGLEEEVRQLTPFRHLNTLNTVGYKEFYQAWDNGIFDTTTIANTIKNHTWQYAKKQLTWIKRSTKA